MEGKMKKKKYKNDYQLLMNLFNNLIYKGGKKCNTQRPSKKSKMDI